MIIQGDALSVLKRMDDESIHCAVTSSPYYGLRSYGTEPLIWDGDPSCQHEWGKVHPPGYRSSDTKPGPLQSEGNTNRQNLKSDICVKCGAWKGELGQEPTPELFVKHITTICHELKRVLRSDGTFWYNIGDSYAANRGYQVPDNIWCDVGNSRGSKVPTGCKPKDLIGIPWMIAFALRADGWYLRADLPWIKRNCLGSGTTIYTRSQKGIMPQTIHDLTRNNSKLIELWNGNKWTRLIDIHKTEEISDGIEIEFRSGEKITCTKEHRWPTNRGIIASSELKVGDIIKKTNLPDTNNSGPLYIPDKIGRIIGLFLAEGSYLTKIETDGALFTISKKETNLNEEIKKFALDYGGSHHSHSYENDGRLMSIIHGKMPMAIIMNYISNKGSKQKCLSNACWQRNNEFLKNLLIGYLEGDGCHDIKNNRWRLGFCENNKLAQDIRTLCARLGISLRLKRGQCSAIKGGKKFPIWRGQIRFEQIDKSINSGNFKLKEDTEIISIKKAKTQHFYDIGVKDDPHLFSLASGLLTHNSMPSSVTDRPCSSIEHVFLFSKSQKYYYDHIATMQPSSESYNKDKRPRGKLRQCVNPNSKYPDEGQFKKLEGSDREVEIGQQTGLRYMRDSDYFFRTWQGLLHNEEGEPMALIVNPRGYKGAHFACFPVQLVEPMILAGTSEKGVCPKCGAPWIRVIEKKSVHYRPTVGTDEQKHKQEPSSSGGLADVGGHMCVDIKTTGWKPSCECGNDHDATTSTLYDHKENGGEYSNQIETVRFEPTCKCNLEPVPATVSDPFGGSSATGVACKLHGRNYIGIELNPKYCDLGKQRIEEGK